MRRIYRAWVNQLGQHLERKVIVTRVHSRAPFKWSTSAEASADEFLTLCSKGRGKGLIDGMPVLFANPPGRFGQWAHSRLRDRNVKQCHRLGDRCSSINEFRLVAEDRPDRGISPRALQSDRP